MRKPLPPVASLSRVIEPEVAHRPVARGAVAQASAPTDQLAVAQAMTRQATALQTPAVPRSSVAPQSTMTRPAEAQLPTERWYQREDPYTTAETDAAFAAFMAGDNPHLRTDEVPVVDFTDMIPKVGPDGRPVRRSARAGSKSKALLAALATTAILVAAVVFGLIDIPGVDGLVPGGEPVVSEATESPEVLSTADGAVDSNLDSGAGDQLIDITVGD